ncbi:MAG TPA: hypothetical protein VKW06_10345 [Candidatus Angelobacter sp.]|nr:hypothetical protein [Candidatus Angelobacter sp.]
MSYVRSNTAPNFGRRDQALGSYFRASFPLPTTSMSRPINSGLGWYNGPYPVYPQPEMSRTRANTPLGGPGPMVVYRVNPATGKYTFFKANIGPNPVLVANPFQRNSLPVISATGVMRGASGPEPMVPMVPIATRFSGLGSIIWGGLRGCHCGSRNCSRCPLSGADTFTDPQTGCVMDTDGNLLTCPGGVDPYQPAAGPPNPDGSLPTPAPSSNPAQMPTVSPAPIAPTVAKSPAGVQFILNTAPQAPTIQQQPASSPLSIFSGSTAGIPNALLIGGGLVVLASMSGGHRR